ncbi:phospho-2-dehydro-3-deoxyheptonate aldolase [Penicillium brasilianum]|uniref:Phospho-2-dehydro-3-deoxyheptonate aldolase n=1 Tax=Penicillium brasilianum TaxID=104259 RepID=A0A1S9RRZ0_PENBI|nr:phospho-2-dehydro-3-deoxyheptonate aldolase [Penicillium brasilianum]
MGDFPVESAETDSMFTQPPRCSWSPQSWTKMPYVAQAVEYSDPMALYEVCNTIASLPPLVSPAKIEIARSYFAAAAQGRAFIVQGGDCAESFNDVRPHIIHQKVRLLQEQSRMLAQCLNLPVITVGRIAGQYAKPRSNPWEVLPDGTKIHAFRGHNVNGPSLGERRPDPHRLLLGYFHSRATLDLMKEGQLPATPPTPGPSTPGIDEMLSGKPIDSFDGPQGAIFTSHEALHLPFESAVTHGRYNTSASFVWIGERTRQLNGGHVEYVRGLRNPIGVKIGPTMDGSTLVELLDILCPNPGNDDNIGRITIITRFGADNVEKVLPSLIRAVKETGHRPVWMCDPCHGNTQTTTCGVKTRHVDRILKELTRTWQIHCENESILGGLHLEQTGEFVTECLDSTKQGSSERGLALNYRSLCDPRLSHFQALNVVNSFADFVSKQQGEKEG